jgi:hypothetical protein
MPTAHETMRAVVQQHVDAWRGHKSFAWAGECGIFADYVFNAAREKGLSVQVDSFNDDANCDSAILPPPGVTLERLREVGVLRNLNHVWVVMGGRHYDAAHPEGVDNPLDLRCARQALVEMLQERNPVLLFNLTQQHQWWRESEAMALEFCAIFNTRDAQYEEN